MNSLELEACMALGELRVLVGRAAMIASACVSAYALRALIASSSGLLCMGFYSFCLLLTLMNRERDGLQLAFLGTAIFATIFCRVSERIRGAEPGRVAVGVRPENKAPMTFVAVMLTFCAVVLGATVATAPSAAQCSLVPGVSASGAAAVFRMRGSTARERMFADMFGRDGHSAGESWQLHKRHQRNPRHRETSFSFEVHGGNLKGKSFRKHLKAVADAKHITGYIMTTDDGESFIGRAQGMDTDMVAFRGALEAGSPDGVQPDRSSYQAEFDTETLMYKFQGFQVIHRNGMSKEDALKEALSPKHEQEHSLYTVDDDNTASTGVQQNVNSAIM